MVIQTPNGLTVELQLDEPLIAFLSSLMTGQENLGATTIESIVITYFSTLMESSNPLNMELVLQHS